MTMLALLRQLERPYRKIELFDAHGHYFRLFVFVAAYEGLDILHILDKIDEELEVVRIILAARAITSLG